LEEREIRKFKVARIVLMSRKIDAKGMEVHMLRPTKSYLIKLFIKKLWTLQVTYEYTIMVKLPDNKRTIGATMKYHVLLIKFQSVKNDNSV
jgi:hypothetical protein